MLSNFGFLCETYLVGSCETSVELTQCLWTCLGLLTSFSWPTVCFTGSVESKLFPYPSEMGENWSSAYLSLVFCKCQQVQNRSSACLSLVFCKCQQVQTLFRPVRILSFLSVNSSIFKLLAKLSFKLLAKLASLAQSPSLANMATFQACLSIFKGVLDPLNT